MSQRDNASFRPPEPLGRSPGSYLTRAYCQMYLDENTGVVHYEGVIDAQFGQVVTVAKSNGLFTSIQDAIDSISDAASDKIYTVLVYPGEYDEAITLGNYIDIVAVDPKTTKILQQVTDNNVECHCYLRITIDSDTNTGLFIRHANSDIIMEGDILSSADSGVIISNGTVKIIGDLSSSAVNGLSAEDGTITIIGNISAANDIPLSVSGGSAKIYGDITGATAAGVSLTAGTLEIHDGTIIVLQNNANGVGVKMYESTGTLILRDVKIVCTHADATSIWSDAAQDVSCYDVYGNRPLHSNITNLIANGFHLADGTNTDVESITATSGGVAADLNVLTTLITTNGDEDEDNVTLADGQVGQVKKFAVIAEGHANDTIKITPANLNGGTQITFSATPVGEGCTMVFGGGAWNIAANNGGTIA